MALKGELEDFSGFDILELIHMKKKTGILFVTSSEDNFYEGKEETVTLGFEEGDLVLAESTAKRLEVQMGKVLVESKRLTEAHLQEGLAIQKESLERLGVILCREGYCSEKDISDAIHVQMKRIVFTLLRWEVGRFVFEIQESLKYFHEFVAPIKVNRLLMEAAVIMDEWPSIKERIHSLDMVFSRIPTARQIVVLPDPDDLDLAEGEEEAKPSELEDAIRFSSVEAAIYELIDGNRSVLDVLNQTFLSEFACCKVFYDLLKRELIESVADGPFVRVKIIPRKGNRAAKASPREMEPVRWGVARALFQGSLPGAIVLGVSLSQKKATLLQGKTDPVSWPQVIMPVVKAADIFANGSPIGSLEYITQHVGLALFWNHKSDYMLVVATPLTGKVATSRFRAHVATIVRSFSSITDKKQA